MKLKSYFQLVLLVAGFVYLACTNNNKTEIIKLIGVEEYNRLINLTMDDFDQSSSGFRQYSNNYELIQSIIPEYIRVHDLSANESRNLHWHLGQIHGFKGNYKDAIAEMKQSYAGGSRTWECYVTGTIAFLEKDKATLLKAYDTLYQQDNVMNIEFLEKFIKHFDDSYVDAYHAGF